MWSELATSTLSGGTSSQCRFSMTWEFNFGHFGAGLQASTTVPYASRKY